MEMREERPWCKDKCSLHCSRETQKQLCPIPFLDYGLMLDSPKNNIQKHVTTLY